MVQGQCRQSLHHREAGQHEDLAPGSTGGRTDRDEIRCRQCAVGQDQNLTLRHRTNGVEQPIGRDLAGEDHCAGILEQPDRTGPGGNRQNSTIGRTDIGGGVDDQSLDPDIADGTGRQPGFDRGSRIRTVHMSGPGACAVTDHNYRITDPVQRLAQGRDAIAVGGADQIHHFVLGAVGRDGVRPPTCLRSTGSIGPIRRRDRVGGITDGPHLPGSASAVVGPSRRSPRADLDQSVEQDEQPARTGIHHPRSPQHSQLRRCLTERLGGALGRGDRDRCGTVLGAVRGSIGRGLQHGQHGAIDGCAQRFPDQGCGPLQRDTQSACGQRTRTGRLGQPPQHLGQDDARIPARADGGRARHRGERVRHACLRGRIHRGTHGDQQIGPGIGIGHRKNVQRIDLIAMLGQPTDTQPPPLP